MLMIKPRGMLMLCVGAVACWAADVSMNVNMGDFLSHHDLVWEKFPTIWAEGAFIGNGHIGAMIYRPSRSQYVRWTIGRTDVWDHQEVGPATHDANLWFKARLPVGGFDLNFTGAISPKSSMRLDLWNAEVRGSLVTDKGEIALRSFTHHTANVTVAEVKVTGAESASWSFAPALSQSSRGESRPANYQPNPSPTEGSLGAVRFCVQPYRAGGDYTTAWQVVELAPGHRVLYTTTANSWSRSTKEEAIATVQNAVRNGLSTLELSHRAWWHEFYNASFLSIPDTRMEAFYWVNIYKAGSFTRADGAPMDFCGPWYSGNEWPGFWWNEGVQCPYYFVYDQNRPQLGESLCRWIDKNVANLKKNVPSGCTDCIAVGRESGLDYRSNVTDRWGTEAGNLPWALHNYWLQYRYTMDDAMLRDRLFPLLKMSMNYYLYLLKPGSDGSYHLPPTQSPELGNPVDANYNLSLIRWECRSLIWTCQRLGIQDPLLPKWKEVLEKIADFPTDANGFMVGKGMPLPEGHRHWSHLNMIYELFVVNMDQAGNRSLINRSFDHYYKMGGWRPFTYAAGSQMAAAIGRPDQALSFLDTLYFVKKDFSINNDNLEYGVSPNTMSNPGGNGVAKNGPFFAQGLHMLALQSWGDVIRPFPSGGPKAWNDMVFHNLAAQGGFLVSAVKRDGATRFVRVKSLAGEPCRVKTDMPRPLGVGADRMLALRELGENVVEVDLKKGETMVLFPGNTLPSLEIAALPPQPGRCNFFGLKRSTNYFGGLDCFSTATHAVATSRLLHPINQHRLRVVDLHGRTVSTLSHDGAISHLGGAKPTGVYIVSSTGGRVVGKGVELRHRR